MRRHLLTLPVTRSRDVVHARQRARAVADRLGFDAQDQTRIATAVSEIARNAYEYARNARIEFFLEDGEAGRLLRILVSDEGPGIADAQQILSGAFRSASGMGLGILGARRMMDDFSLETSPSGTAVQLGKRLPRTTPPLSEHAIAAMAAMLAAEEGLDPLTELRRQNQELINSLNDLQEREAQLEAANRELRQASEALRVSVEQKDVLLREVHHRVKNNLQIITSLLNLQMSQSASPEVRNELKSIWNRIQSLAIIHDKLYQSPDVSQIDIADYLSELCRQLQSFHQDLPARVNVELDMDRIAMPIDVAINVGLIVNEMVTNSFRHAFRGMDRGTIRVTLKRQPSATLRLEVGDNGRGLPPEDLGEAPRHLGFRVVRALVSHLSGELSVVQDHGARFIVTMPADRMRSLQVAS